MRVAALVQACHPEPSLAVTAIATALALSVGRGSAAIWVAAAVLSGQLSVGWSNDWIDLERDRRSGRTDKPAARGELSARTLRAAAGSAAAACVPLSLLMGWRPGLVHLVAVAGAWGYNARLKSTVLSWLPYALAFGLIPSVVTLGLPAPRWAPAWASVAGGLLGVGAHLANVLPDLEDDAATGVRGLPHRLGRRRAIGAAAMLLLAATVLLAVGSGQVGGLGLAAIAVAMGITTLGLRAGGREGSRTAFRAVIAVAAVDVGLLLARGSMLR